MEENEEIDKHTDIDVFVAYQRGNFIHLMIIIESMLEDIIKQHYCKENLRDEFVFSVLAKENFSFSTKYQLVCFILKNHYEDFYVSNNLKISALETLITDRNHFAHRKFFSANPANAINKNGTYYFEHYKTESNKTKIKPIEYNVKIYSEKLKQISITTKLLIEVYKLMGINYSEIVKYYEK